MAGLLTYPKLPKPSEGPQVEFDDEVALEYYRMEKMHEGSLDLQPGETGTTSLPTQTGSKPVEDPTAELSQIIEQINEALGTRDFTDADRLLIEQVGEHALEDAKLQEAARMNTEEQFAHVFDEKLEGMFLDRMDQNTELLRAFLDNPAVKRAITEYLRKKVYRESREDGEEASA